MAFDVVFAIFILLMVGLAVFVTRFSIRLNRDRRRQPPDGGGGKGDGPLPPPEAG